MSLISFAILRSKIPSSIFDGKYSLIYRNFAWQKNDREPQMHLASITFSFARKRMHRPYLSDLLQDTSVSAPAVAAACNHARNSKAERGKLSISQARFLIAQGIILLSVIDCRRSHFYYCHAKIKGKKIKPSNICI